MWKIRLRNVIQISVGHKSNYRYVVIVMYAMLIWKRASALQLKSNHSFNTKKIFSRTCSDKAYAILLMTIGSLVDQTVIPNRTNLTILFLDN